MNTIKRSGSIETVLAGTTTMRVGQRPRGRRAIAQTSRRRLLALAAAWMGVASLPLRTAHAAKVAVEIAPPSRAIVQASERTSPLGETRTAVFAGGCFWGVQAVFQHTKGVLDAVSGYTGGSRETADYETTSTVDTGHRQSVKVSFDPRVINYTDLLHIFFSVAHDPTQTDGQNKDIGPQYLSALFLSDETQHEVARRYIEELEEASFFPERIVTELKPLDAFYPAEPEHQNYVFNNPQALYVIVVDKPMLANMERMFPDRYQSKPQLLDMRSFARIR